MDIQSRVVPHPRLWVYFEVEMGVTGPSKEWWRLHIVTVLWLDLLSHLHRQLQQKADAKSAGPI